MKASIVVLCAGTLAAQVAMADWVPSLPVRASQSNESCIAIDAPRVIRDSGSYCLVADLQTTWLVPVTIEADDVTLDLAGHSIGCLGCFAGVQLSGTATGHLRHVHVTNGSISGAFRCVSLFDNFIAPSSSYEIDHVTCMRPGGPGLYVAAGDPAGRASASVHDNFITSGQAFGDGGGIDVTSGTATIRSNHLFGLADSIRVAVNPGSEAPNLVIYGNEIIDSDQFAMLVGHAVGAIITDNTISGCTWAGMILTGSEYASLLP